MKKSETSFFHYIGLKRKLLLKMKLTLIGLFLCLMQVSASVYSQATKFSFELKQTQVADVLREIEQESNFRFFYQREQVNVERQISINADNNTVEEVLTALFKDEGIKYKVLENDLILLSPKTKNFSTLIDAEQKSVSGIVTDESGEPLPGVTVIVKGTTIGVVTNADGEYTLVNSPEDATLQFSFVGMTTQEIPVGTQTNINVTMVVDAIGLEEIVAVGYGTQKKVNLTGSISTVRNDELVKVTSTDLRTSMVGKLPGLRVMQRSSEPGSYDSQLDIRGWGNPLVIVDGVPRSDFQKIDPNTVESITILKDASAAVYGVEAANGVILIESKAGKVGEAQISFTSTYGVQRLAEFPIPIGNAIQSLELKNEAALAQFNSLPYPDYLEYDGTDPLKPSVDYWDLTVRDYSPQTQNVVNVSGGSEKVTYFLSFGHMYDMGMFKTDNLKYNRFNVKSNIKAQITDNLEAQMIITGLQDNKRRPYGHTSYDFMKQVWMQPPWEPVYYTDPETGAYDETKYFDGQADRNPLGVIDPDASGYQDLVNKQLELTTSLIYSVPFVEGLSLKGLFAYDSRTYTQKQWRKDYKEWRPNGTYVTPQGSPRLRHVFDEWKHQQIQLSANYQKTFDQHNVEGLLLYEQRTGSGNGFGAGRYFALDLLDQLDAGSTENMEAWGREKVPGDGISAANRGIVGRVNYDFSSKYIAEFSFRYDGSSNFPKETRWGFFPAASLGWRISEEAFIKDNVPSISNLKLRASHGILGDHSAASGFRFVEGYDYPSGGYLFSGNQYVTGSSYRGIANPNITWYTATTSNIGADLSLWNGLLGATVDVFQRKRDDLLANRAIAIPGTFGTTLPTENLESDLSKGFEVELSHFNTIGEVRYQAKGTFSFTRTKWLHREATPAGNSWAEWRNANEDRWANIAWGYGWEGQFQTEEEIRTLETVQLANGHRGMWPGDVKYQDWNEDGMIDGHDAHPIARDHDPEVYFSLNLSADWKGLAVSAFFQGATRYTIRDREQLEGPLPWGRNSFEFFLDRWHHEDPVDWTTPWVPGKYPVSREAFGYGPNKAESPFRLTDITYLRLKNLEISYTLPSRWTDYLNLEQVRVFTNGLNLYTWSPEKTKKDPEQPTDGDGADHGYKYPIMVNYNVGINVIF